jgi:two-component system, sensor histidine kinase and response regulator
VELTRHIPIIFVTASLREASGLFRGYEAGAVDFLYKPIEPIVLRNKAETFFELHRQRQLLAQQVELLRAQELDTRRAKDAAEAANLAKDEFLANVTHEIRTPMNAILGLTEVVLDTQLTEGQRQSLRTVHSAAGHLLAMINDVLDFSKIGAGKLELDRSPFALRESVGETMRALAIRAHRKGLELVCDIDPDVPDALVGDVGRCRQVVSNLVGNAIKFTERGEVVFEMGLTRSSPASQGVGLRCAVRDTGIGISRDKQAAIFRAFEQEDSSTTRKYGGTGLGLTIAAQLVAMMDGQLEVESDVGAGSVFTFTAWLGQGDTSAETTVQSPEKLRGLRALIVERNAACRRALERWLRHAQLDVTSVDSVAAAEVALAARPYDLVLLDAKLPALEQLAASTLTILLTSDDSPETSGDAYLRKPVMPGELVGTILRMMGGLDRTSEARHTPQPAMPTRVATPLRILLAEDNDFNSQLMRQLLGTRGHDVRVAATGREALELASTSTYDLLLLDIHMPELDGFQVIRAIRDGERGTKRHLPVIAVTARSRDSDRDNCLDAGMDDYLVKPISAKNLWSAIDRIVRAATPL